MEIYTSYVEEPPTCCGPQPSYTLDGPEAQPSCALDGLGEPNGDEEFLYHKYLADQVNRTTTTSFFRIAREIVESAVDLVEQIRVALLHEAEKVATQTEAIWIECERVKACKVERA